MSSLKLVAINLKIIVSIYKETTPCIAIHRKAVHHRENIAANAAVADADNISSVNVAVKIRSTCSFPVILYISC